MLVDVVRLGMRLQVAIKLAEEPPRDWAAAGCSLASRPLALGGQLPDGSALPNPGGMQAPCRPGDSRMELPGGTWRIGSLLVFHHRTEY